MTDLSDAGEQPGDLEDVQYKRVEFVVETAPGTVADTWERATDVPARSDEVLVHHLGVIDASGYCRVLDRRWHAPNHVTVIVEEPPEYVRRKDR